MSCSTSQTGNGDGGFHWQVVGLGTAGKSAAAWVTWDESSANGGLHSVFVARLDPAGDHFDLLNNGQPISHSGLDSTRPDIVFAGNTPYVSWHETNSTGQTVTIVGHFEGNPANPVFHIDTPDIPTTPQGISDNDTTDVRSPIASTCPDDPFTADGQACAGGAVGTPFYAFTDNANGPQKLFAQTYTLGGVQTGGSSGIGKSTGTATGTVSTDGARTLVHFEYGISTAYGATTTAQLLAPTSTTSTPFPSELTWLPTAQRSTTGPSPRRISARSTVKITRSGPRRPRRLRRSRRPRRESRTASRQSSSPATASTASAVTGRSHYRCASVRWLAAAITVTGSRSRSTSAPLVCTSRPQPEKRCTFG
jgi:hypothetical protein